MGIVERRATLEKAVAAGEKAVWHALGEEAFEEEEGHFWGILETRPTMRARAFLAERLWEMGDRDEAVAHWRDMLRLCPNDNMGLRHVLAPKLLHLNRFEATRELLDEYEEPHFAEWSYTDALLKFKQGGATSGATKALAAAIRHNPHVPAYLLGEKRLPKQPPPHYALGSKEEAVLYVLSSLETWTSTRGALAWLSETAKKHPVKNQPLKICDSTLLSFVKSGSVANPVTDPGWRAVSQGTRYPPTQDHIIITVALFCGVCRPMIPIPSVIDPTTTWRVHPPKIRGPRPIGNLYDVRLAHESCGRGAGRVR